MNFKTESKIAYRVKPNCFYPAPNVDSVLLLVKTLKTDCEPNLEAKFLKFVQDIFVQRRKTIINNLTGKYGYDKAKLIEKFTQNNIRIDLRAESLDTKQIFELFECIVSQ